VATPNASDSRPTRAVPAASRGRDAWRQERLARAVAVEPLFLRRVRVLLAAGVLAFSAAGASTSVATEPDQTGEGNSAPGQGEVAPVPELPSPPSEPLGAPPGDGGDTAIPFESQPSPADPVAEPDAEPLEGEPLDDPYGRLVLTNPEAAPPPTDDTPTLVPEAPAPEAPSAPDDAAPTEPAPAPPVEGQQFLPQPELIGSEPSLGSADRGAQGERSGKARRKPKRHATRDPAPPREGSLTPPATSAPQAPTASSADQSITVQAAPAPSLAARASEPPPGIPRFHIVRPGESLWEIASKLLGPRASDAAIAREVSRLWWLNERRIGTGDPNLLIAGVELRLR
jgi:hypothetical protein